MALSKVSINIKNGGLAREAAGEDHISGIISYNDSVPSSGITSLGDIKKYGSYQEAESDGITEDSDNKQEWYHLKEFFLQNPNGVCYLGIFSTAETYDYAEIEEMQSEADGTIRQMAIIMPDDYGFTASELNDIQTECDNRKDDYEPVQILFSPSFTGETEASDLTSLTDLRDGSYNNPDVSVVLGYDETSYNSGLSMAGAALGVLSRSKVSDSIAWVGANNLLSKTSEFSTIKLGGVSYSDLSSTQLDTINDLGYIFVRKFPNKGGSYISSALTTTETTDDFCDIQTRRTILKVYRGVYENLLPLLNSSILIDSDNGTIDYIAVKNFEDKGGIILEQMKRDNEISDGSVFVDPDQDVLSNSRVDVSLTVVPYATAKEIRVDLGLSTTI
jgi:hypothetical protein